MLNLMIVHLFGLMTPGPDFFYVARMAVGDSKRHGIYGICGITLGIMFWAAASMLGLAILFVTVPTLHGVIMFLGGSYLAYQGVTMIKSQKYAALDHLSTSELNRRDNTKKEILRGLFVNLSNPKAVVYFTSVMSLVLVNMTEIWEIGVAFVIIVIETFIYFYLVFVLFSRPMAKRIYHQYHRYVDLVAGFVFLIFGGLLIYNGIKEIFYL